MLFNNVISTVVTIKTAALLLSISVIILIFKLIKSGIFRYVDWVVAFRDFASIVKLHLFADLKIPKLLLLQRPWMLFIAYRLSTITFLIVVLQLLATVIFVIMFYVQFAYYFTFKLNYTWAEENESIPLKFLFRAVLYKLFVGVPRARAFTIFYITLKLVWNVSNLLIIKFSLGKPIIQPVASVGPLTHVDYNEVVVCHTSRASGCFLTGFLLASFLLIKLPLSIILGVSYISFILACRLIHNSHWEDWSWPQNSFRNLYERTAIFGVILMVDNSFIKKFKITGKLYQIDNLGYVVFNQHFPDESVIDTKPIAEFVNSISNIKQDSDSDSNSELEIESEINDDTIDKAFAEIFGDSALKHESSSEDKPSIEKLQEEVASLNEELSKIDPATDYSVYSKDTTLQYRLLFNPTRNTETTVTKMIKDANILTKSKDLPIKFSGVSTYYF